MIVERLRGFLNKVFHGHECGVFEDPLAIVDADHLLEALLVNESECVIVLPLEVVDNPYGIEI